MRRPLWTRISRREHWLTYGPYYDDEIDDMLQDKSWVQHLVIRGWNHISCRLMGHHWIEGVCTACCEEREWTEEDWAFHRALWEDDCQP